MDDWCSHPPRLVCRTRRARPEDDDDGDSVTTVQTAHTATTAWSVKGAHATFDDAESEAMARTAAANPITVTTARWREVDWPRKRSVKV